MTFEEFELIQLENYPYKTDARILAQFAWKQQQQEINKLKQENERLKKALEEIANGHLHEKVSESIARQALKQLEE